MIAVRMNTTPPEIALGINVNALIGIGVIGLGIVVSLLVILAPWFLYRIHRNIIRLVAAQEEANKLARQNRAVQR